jgi:uncharacterized protein YukE
MPSFLAQELEQLRRSVDGEQWKRDHEWSALADDASEMAALAVHLLARVDAAAAKKQPAGGGWDEAAARAFVPLFRQWLEYATRVDQARRACKQHGYTVEGADAFLHALNRARIMAVDFESVVEAHRRLERGEARGRPLQEVVDELRGHPGAGGGG